MGKVIEFRGAKAAVVKVPCMMLADDALAADQLPAGEPSEYPVRPGADDFEVHFFYLKRDGFTEVPDEETAQALMRCFPLFEPA
jgi:hypothetical protein